MAGKPGKGGQKGRSGGKPFNTKIHRSPHFKKLDNLVREKGRKSWSQLETEAQKLDPNITRHNLQSYQDTYLVGVDRTTKSAIKSKQGDFNAIVKLKEFLIFQKKRIDDAIPKEETWSAVSVLNTHVNRAIEIYINSLLRYIELEMKMGLIHKVPDKIDVSGSIESVSIEEKRIVLEKVVRYIPEDRREQFFIDSLNDLGIKIAPEVLDGRSK